MLAPTAGHGQAPVATECHRRDLRPGGELSPLPLGPVDQRHDLVDGRDIEPCLEQLGAALRADDVAFEQGVQQLVRRQRVLVGLARA